MFYTRELLTAPETAQIVNDCMFEAGALMNLRFGADKSRAVWLTVRGGRWGATDPQLQMNGERVKPIAKADDYLFRYVGWPISMVADHRPIADMLADDVKSAIRQILGTPLDNFGKLDLIELWLLGHTTWLLLITDPGDTLTASLSGL